MSSSSSSSATSRSIASWLGKLRFEDKETGEEFFFKDKEVIGKMKAFCMEGGNLREISYYTCTGGIHGFILTETCQGWYYSVEKHDTGISLQRSKSESSVRDYFRSDARAGPILCAFVAKDLYSAYYTMTSVIEWLYEKDELRKRYDFAFNNCRDFARRLIHSFCSRSDDMAFTVLITIGGGRHSDGIITAPVRVVKALAECVIS